MNAKLAILGALALLAAPLAYAHDPAGTPKNYCEPQSDWMVHDYAPPATGSLLVLNEDGNLAGDCDGITNVHPGTPCAGFEDPNDPLTFFVGLCDADINPPIADWDEHNEWAKGGAWLLVDSGLGTPGSGGTLDCFGAEGHHTAGGIYSVNDLALGSGTSFSIAADRVDAASEASGGTIPPAPCGDFETDEAIDCIGSCAVPFGPGLDGAYIAFVQGTAGHVIDGPGPTPLQMPPGHITVHDFGTGPIVLTQPPGWACSPLAVTGTTATGATWTMTCTPPGANNVCASVGTLGYGITNVAMTITSACAGLSTTQTGTGSSSMPGAGAFPWTCSVNVQAQPPIDVWAHCYVN